MTEPLRILILEENPTDVKLIQFELKEAGFSFAANVVVTEKGYVRELRKVPRSQSFPTMTSPDTMAPWHLPSKEQGPDVPSFLYPEQSLKTAPSKSSPKGRRITS